MAFSAAHMHSPMLPEIEQLTKAAADNLVVRRFYQDANWGHGVLGEGIARDCDLSAFAGYSHAALTKPLYSGQA